MPGEWHKCFGSKPTTPEGCVDAVVSTELLDEHLPEALGTALIGLRVAERLRSTTGSEVLVTSWSVKTGRTDS